MQNEPASAVRVERWPTEIPLLVLVIFTAAGIWVLAALSLLGIFYAVFLGVFFFLAHIAFIAHVKGSAIRLGPDQFPDLHQRVNELALRVGLKKPPDTYLMQAGGTLNALATRFLRSHMIVLYSDLLDACGDDQDARDMVIGHELGHLRAGHLTGFWFLIPGLLFPFLGSAYSRAREYTCDRYGAAVCDGRDGALVGLAILAAGGSHGPRVNLNAMSRQRHDLDTGWMTLGTWLSTHPPLSARITALDPTLDDATGGLVRGPARAVAILALAALIPFGAGALAVRSFIPAFTQAMEEARAAAEGGHTLSLEHGEFYRGQIDEHFQVLAAVADQYESEFGHLPEDVDLLYEHWQQQHPDSFEPADPFDGLRYGYYRGTTGYVLWSSGPDGDPGTVDDIVFASSNYSD